MKKAVLVMNMPEGCQECGFCRCDGDMCLLLNEDIPEKMYLDGERLSSCPLRELPEYMKGEPKKDYNKMYKAGYNACLDNILNK